MADIWVFTANGYYRVNATTMVRSTLFPYPLDSPLVQEGRRPGTDGTFVYASSSGTDVFYRIGKATGTFERVTVGDLPRMFADDGTNLWVGNDLSGTVSKVSKASMTVTGTETIANNGQVLWVDPYLWVAESGASPTGAVIRVYNPVTDAIIQTITLTTTTADVQDLAYYNGHVYVAVRFVDRLYKVSTSTFASVADSALSNPSRLRIVDNHVIAVASAGLVKIDPDDLSVVDTLAGTYLHITTDGIETLFAMTFTTLRRVDVPSMTETGSSVIGLDGDCTYDELPPVVSAAGWGINTITW